MTETLATAEGGRMKTLEEIALQIGKEVFGAVDECLSGQGERDREVTAGEYPIGEGCIDFARRLVAALGAQSSVGESDGDGTVWWKDMPPSGTKLYAAPYIKEGWQMVPQSRYAELIQCCEDMATGKGGWAWEDVLNEHRAILTGPEYKP